MLAPACLRFCARVTGKADLCKLTVSCTSETCDTKVPYRDEVVLQVVLQGMCDKDVRARTLTRLLMENLKNSLKLWST